MAIITYYSTNRNLDGFSGITPFQKLVSFKDALLVGQAPDEGLFMPNRIPQLSLRAIKSLRGAPYADAAQLIAASFLSQELPEGELRTVVDDAYNFPVPLESVEGRKYIMRLDQGPTASFKDFAARMMARLMSCFRDKNSHLNVLVATSGDTGGAVGDAFRGVPGVSVWILYPTNEVSGIQKKQLDTIGGNVQAISIAGKFDDCQDLVKQAFTDPALTPLHLTSANSINFGRIMPQIVYFVYAYAQLAEDNEEIVFSVPSGNFGDAMGCEYARRMGLPVKKILVPTNENSEFPNFLKTGRYEPVVPSRACLSNAMNVGHPSNLARFFDLYGGTIDRKGKVYKYPDLEEMKRHLFSVSVSDEDTRQTIRKTYERYGTLLEPHGAVGWRGLELYLAAMGEEPLSVSLETAHPAKFPEEIKSLLNITPELPASMEGLASRRGSALSMPNDYQTLKDYLISNLQSRD